jgi:hypothetical protein
VPPDPLLADSGPEASQTEQHTAVSPEEQPRLGRFRVRTSTWTERLWFFVFVAALSSVILATTNYIWGSVVPPEDVVMAGTNDPQVRARFLMHKGQMLLRAGRPDEGLASLRRGLDLALQYRLRALTASGLLSVGIAFRHMDQPDSALMYLENARDVCARSGDSRAAEVAAEHLRSVQQALEPGDRQSFPGQTGAR